MSLRDGVSVVPTWRPLLPRELWSELTSAVSASFHEQPLPLVKRRPRAVTTRTRSYAYVQNR